MSCIACETFAKRITNIFRDEELKVKYAELTGFKVFQAFKVFVEFVYIFY